MFQPRPSNLVLRTLAQPLLVVECRGAIRSSGAILVARPAAAVVGSRRTTIWMKQRSLHTTVPRSLVGGSGGRSRTRWSSKKAAATATTTIRPDTLPHASSSSSSHSYSAAAPYGLQMVHYRTNNFEAPLWTLPPHPPLQGGPVSYRLAQYLAPTLAAAAFLGMVYVFFNPDEDMVDYWRQVEQGNVPIEGDDDDDDDDDDEWKDDKDAKK